VPRESGRVGRQRGKALNPPVHRDGVDLNTTLDRKFLDVAVGQVKPQIPSRLDYTLAA
jgi:hypothetical protein